MGTPECKYAYTANFISGTVSSYTVGLNGSASLIDGATPSLRNGSEPVDLALTGDGKCLYNLLRGYGSIAKSVIQGDPLEEG